MGHISNQQKAYLLAIVTVLFWCTVPTAFKIGLRYQDNFQMVTGAALVSTLVLGITIIIQQKLKLVKTLKFKDLIRAALLGVLSPAFYYIVLFKAYDLLPAQVAQPLNMTWPIILVLISIPFLGQKIRWPGILAMIVSFGGIIILSLQGGSLFDQRSNIYGVMLALSSAFIWALYWIMNMRTKIDEILGLFLIFLFSTIYLLVGGIIRQPGLPVGRDAWLSSAYIGIFEMGLSFILWLKALQLSITTAKISNLVYLAPFINLIFVRHILGETIYISTIFGILLVVSGIIIQNLVKIKDVTS